MNRFILFLATSACLAACDDGDADPAPTPDTGTDATVVDAMVDPTDGAPDMPGTDMNTPDLAMVDGAMPDAAPEPEPAAGACPADQHLGGFFISLEDGFTAVQGQVADGVLPAVVPEIAAEDGPCALLVPPTLFCDPACEAGQVCSADGCRPAPVNIDLGVANIDGLAAPVSMEARPPVFFYTFRGDLPDPPYMTGAALRLTAGGGDHEALDLTVRGIERLALMGGDVPLRMGEPAALAWTPPGDPSLSEIHIDLNIANHGGTPGRIECVVPDTGSFAVPSSLVDRLLANGFSGFPTAVLTRRSVNSVTGELGCIQFDARSTGVFDVQIDGLTSCSNDMDCPDGQTCQVDLTCGE
jgi:hypothetical protein